MSYPEQREPQSGHSGGFLFLFFIMEESKKQFRAALLLALVVSAVTLVAVFVGFQLAGGNSAPAADPVRLKGGGVEAIIAQHGLRVGTSSELCGQLHQQPKKQAPELCRQM